VRATQSVPHPQYLYPRSPHTLSTCNPFRASTTPSALLVTPSFSSSLVTMLSPTEETTADIKSATAGFDMIFSNELEKAEDIFGKGDSAIHLLGSGACAFLRAALSLEVRTRLNDTVLRPYNTPPDWSYLGSLKSPRTGRSRREEAAQERKERQADQSFSRRNRVGPYLFRLCHPPRIELCFEVC
jgi:hypothetical protein